MTAEQFAYWLQGFSEIAGEAPNAEQWKSIQDHLQLVFQKVTPPMAVPIDWHIIPDGIAAPRTNGAQTLC